LEEIKSRLIKIEKDLAGPISKGATGFIELRHEVIDATDGVERAIEVMDNTFGNRN
jgi:hypothetical protein